MYCVLEKPDDCQWVLRRQGKVWLTFWMERGRKFHLERFKTESAACEYFYNQVTNRAF
ncbi:hypothetical protein GCM10009850_064330 [Nonomuraea monospora]|uniref:Transposase n=2 Tax=Nonomuraea monospora TaxID=568818 RepID=A0ABN3CNI8_9ACTN